MNAAGHSRLSFSPLEEYLRPVADYSLLPFRFERLESGRVLLTNDIGDFHVLTDPEFNDLLGKRLDTTTSPYLDLLSKHFVHDRRSALHSRVMASRYRTKKSFLEGFAKLHIFVVTLRCDHSCPYCQVSRQSEDKLCFDMTQEMADRAIELMLKTPARAVTCELQGGESLLNFALVQHIVETARRRNKEVGKRITFVACTNLSTLSNEHLDFFQKHGVLVSTSLDGPQPLHDKNRPYSRGSSYEVVVRNICRVQEALGRDHVSALMTTTKESLSQPREIIDEYLRQGLGSVFLRPLSPFGFAAKTARAIGYSVQDFLRFYKEALAYILDLNLRGTTFPEVYATLQLRRRHIRLRRVADARRDAGQQLSARQHPRRLLRGHLLRRADAHDSGSLLQRVARRMIRLCLPAVLLCRSGVPLRDPGRHVRAPGNEWLLPPEHGHHPAPL